MHNERRNSRLSFANSAASAVSHNRNPAGHLRETRARRRAGITERRAADRTVGTDHADFDAVSVAQVHQQQPAALAAEIT
jgi:hypothetical protein